MTKQHNLLDWWRGKKRKRKKNNGNNGGKRREKRKKEGIIAYDTPVRYPAHTSTRVFKNNCFAISDSKNNRQ